MMFDFCCRRRVLCALFAFAVSMMSSRSIGAATLTWNPSTDPAVAGYVVYIGTAPGEYFSSVDVGTQSWYQFTVSNSGATYYFAIRAYTADGLFSPYSEEVVYAPAATSQSQIANPSAGGAEAANALPVTLSGTNAFAALAHAATLTAIVDAKVSVIVSFQYGLTTAYGKTTDPATLSAGTGSVALPVSGLTCDTIYHFRAVATTEGASTYGDDASFRTDGCDAQH